MRTIRLNDNGDTLVEVLLATAVLSLVMAGVFTLSNRATRLSQTANERTNVSNLMQEQAEYLRAKFSTSSTAFWESFDNHDTGGSLISSTENYSYCDSAASPTIDDSFYLKPDLSVNLLGFDLTNGKITDDGQNDDLYNIWIEAVDDDANSPAKYTDFFIYACWEGIGGEQLQKSGLVLRFSRL